MQAYLVKPIKHKQRNWSFRPQKKRQNDTNLYEKIEGKKTVRFLLGYIKVYD